MLHVFWNQLDNIYSSDYLGNVAEHKHTQYTY